MTSDAYDLVQPDPSGAAQARAMRLALEDAGLSASDVAHVNAHATSTPAGDMVEARAIRTALESSTDGVGVTGSKSALGHMLGAAGAIETLVTVMTLYERVIPPTINLRSPEPELNIDVVTSKRKLPSKPLAALSNSFGFGGHNIAVALTDENAVR
jgi:3-oxoacyl-[acyl-carrier-protein] synthase II